MPHESIPSLPARPLMGNLHLIDADKPTQSMVSLTREHGHIFSFRALGGAKPMVFVSDPALVEEMCDTERFEKVVHAALEEIRDFAGDGLFTAYSHEPNWGVAHRILMPTFGPIAVRSMFDEMVDIADQMLVRWERFGSSAVVDVSKDMTRLTLDTIALCAFGYRFNSFYGDELHPFVGAMVESLREADNRSVRPDVLNALFVKSGRRYQDNIAYMQRIADEIVQERRASGARDEHEDLLSRMLEAADPLTGERLSDENIRNQMITFLIAGHETTSGLLSFAIHALLSDPDLMARARGLVDEVLADEPMTVHHLSKLGFLEQILKETLRLWPTAPAFGVRALEPTTLGGRYHVDPSDELLVLTPALHVHPDVW